MSRSFWPRISAALPWPSERLRSAMRFRSEIIRWKTVCWTESV